MTGAGSTRYVTPDDTSPAKAGFCVSLPDDEFLLAAFRGALEHLANPDNWQEVGTMTPEQAAQHFADAIEATYPLTGC